MANSFFYLKFVKSYDFMKEERKDGIKYFVPVRDKTLKNFQVFGVGIRELMRPCIVNRPQGTGDRLFMYFHDCVKIKLGEEIRDFPPGTLMIWDDSAGHYYGNPDVKWRHSWLHCKGRGSTEILKKLGLTSGRTLSLTSPSAIENYLMMIFMEVSSPAAKPDEKILFNLFENFLREIKRDAIEKTALPHHIPVNILKAKTFLDSAPFSQTSLKKLSNISCLSIPHFSAEFKKAFGISPIEYAISLKMRHARYLLLDHNLSVTEVADTVGYKDIFQFSKNFKKRFGSSLLTFRESH